MTEHLTDVDKLPAKEFTLAEARELVRKHEDWFKLKNVPSVSRTLVREIERLRATLTGISTCSTCEACRGAALRALGEQS